MVGTWSSLALAAPSASSCSNFQWAVTSQSATSIVGVFSAECAGHVTISGTASGQLIDGTTVPITVGGAATMQGLPVCNFTLNGVGTIEDNFNTMRIPYTGTTCLGPVSGTETLHRPQPATPPPPPTPDPPPAPEPPPPGIPGDAIDLGSVRVYNSPADIASWPVTAKITNLTMRSPEGLSFAFTTQNSWPNAVPPGFTGGIQYTVWAVVNVNGQWYTSGFIEMWQGRPNTGAPILSDFARNWAYDSRWGAMAGHQPQVGEQMGFFLSAGDARGNGGPTSLRERSNVVLVSLPAGDNGSFSY
jgi:hypothetical protein